MDKVKRLLIMLGSDYRDPEVRMFVEAVREVIDLGRLEGIQQSERVKAETSGPEMGKDGNIILKGGDDA